MIKIMFSESKLGTFQIEIIVNFIWITK